MKKQELIKLIESIDFEQVKGFRLNYLKEKQNRFNESNEIETLCYGEDFINYMQREMSHMHQRIDRIGENLFRLRNKEEK